MMIGRLSTVPWIRRARVHGLRTLAKSGLKLFKIQTATEVAACTTNEDFRLQALQTLFSK
jgi:hypothetical protein